MDDIMPGLSRLKKNESQISQNSASQPDHHLQHGKMTPTLLQPSDSVRFEVEEEGSQLHLISGDGKQNY